MKKLMRKLVLSSFALGLAVITLSTTTFAWYTSNKNVTADNIMGTSSTSGADLLMITQDTEDGTPVNWDTTVSVYLDKAETTGVNEANGSNGMMNMSPVAYDSKTNEFVNMDDTSATGGWLYFTLYFRLASAPTTEGQKEKLYISKFDVKNMTNSLPYKDILAGGHEHLGVANTEQKYKVDILRTLMVQVESCKYTQTTQGGSINADATNLFALYDLENLNEANHKADSLDGKTFNAHKYFNAVMKDSKIADADLEGRTYTGVKDLAAKGAKEHKLYIDELPSADNVDNAGSYLKVTFRIFINGWDKACFDACQGQKIQVELAFTTVENDALTY